MTHTIPCLTTAERERFLREIEAAHKRPLLPDADAPPVEVIPPAGAPERLDGAVIWARLTPEQQTALGAAAIEIAVARMGCEVARSAREESWFLDAEECATEALDDAAAEHVFVPGVVAPDQVPPVPSLLGAICGNCGRTEREGCWTPPWTTTPWPAPGRCPACIAEGPVEARGGHTQRGGR